MALKLAFIGYGEVGQLFARQLAAKGQDVAVHDILFHDPSRAPSLLATAAADRVHATKDLADACRGRDVVISAVTADRAVEVAAAAAPVLAPGQIYVDLNSVSPTSKGEVAAQLAPSGADFVEFAVMAPVAGTGIATGILAGGSRAAELADRLNPLGFVIEAVSDRIGVASATKLCRSIVIKGMEALMVDLMLATEKTGVLPGVLASLSKSYPDMDWAKVLEVMPTRVERHGVRRAAEMREVARMLEENGLSGALAHAIAERHETYAQSKRKEKEAAAAAPGRHVHAG